MRPTALFTERRAVSPVIGVVLMLAITVALAATVAVFVLPVASNISTTPQTTFTFATTTDAAAETAGATGVNVTITHQGGDNIATSDVLLSDGGGFEATWQAVTGDIGTVRAGDTATISSDSGNTVRVVYSPEDSDTSATLATFNVP